MKIVYVNDTKTSERKGIELALYQDIGNIKIENNTAFIMRKRR